jgi:hypothetical protein
VPKELMSWRRQTPQDTQKRLDGRIASAVTTRYSPPTSGATARAR